MKKIFFFEKEYYMLSNWSAHAVEIWGNTFMTADHAYHWKKFVDSNPEIAEEIFKAKSPEIAKDIANKSKNLAKQFSDEEKIEIFYQINKAKCNQHQDIKKALIESGNQEIIEDSPFDSFWGWGADKNGRNELGKIWMRIREDLRN